MGVGSDEVREGSRCEITGVLLKEQALEGHNATKAEDMVGASVLTVSAD